MDYSLYRLSFSTALHIGKDSGGASLEDGQMSIHADTLVAALCCEAARDASMQVLLDCFADGTLTVSDALPYAGDEMYLPKPVLFMGERQPEGEAGLKKQLKAVEYIPLSGFDEYLQGLKSGRIAWDELQNTFGQLTTTTRVGIAGNTAPLPYHVAAWKFARDCGLYIIVRSRQAEALELFSTMLTCLGLSGIGGKQSSGWGKFQVANYVLPSRLLELLEDEQAEYQMLLGTALPADDELEPVLENGWYTLIRRGGFIRSATYAPGQIKKRSMYMLGPGSCLARRFTGDMYDLAGQGTHPVWRCGKSLFVGVNL